MEESSLLRRCENRKKVGVLAESNDERSESLGHART